MGNSVSLSSSDSSGSGNNFKSISACKVSSIVKTCDLYLLRQRVKDTSGSLNISLDPSIIRGIVATQEGKSFAIQNRKIPGRLEEI